MSEEEATVFTIYMWFWEILDGVFTYIEDAFVKIFWTIPLAAMPFLIGIVSFSFLMFIKTTMEYLEQDYKKLLMRLIYPLIAGLCIIFSMWRFGFIAVLEYKLNTKSISVWVVNTMYIVFIIILVYSFLKEVPWLQKFLICFLWAGLLLITFVVAPLFNESELITDTVMHTFIVGAVFITPWSLDKYKQKQKQIMEG